MQLRTLPNPERGCGQLKEGGFYARGDCASNGTLNSWTWILGQHIVGGRNFSVTVPARQMQVIRLPETLHTQRLMTEPLSPEVINHSPLDVLQPLALIDHVGSDNYTPFSFAAECGVHGPSRRIPENIAKAIAKHTPIPILFTHKWLPIADTSVMFRMLRWAAPGGDLNSFFYGVTTERPDWGMSRGNYRGDDHWMLPMLIHMDRASDGKQKHLTEIMPAELAEQSLLAEQIYGASWITRVVYVASDNDTEESLEDIMKAGVEPVRLEQQV